MAFCLVTGGAGFIGSHLVEKLLEYGHKVRVLDNLSTGNPANLVNVQNEIEWLNGDVTDLAAVRTAVREVEYVFHEAALTPVPVHATDTLAAHHACATGTLHVLVAAREAQVRRVIYAASSSAYGNSAALPMDEQHATHPLSPAAVAKLTGEGYCGAFHHLYGLETVRLRYFNVFGPRQTADPSSEGILPHLIETMLAGRHPVIHGDGLQAHDFTFVADIVQANLLALETPRAAGRVYNIASGRCTTWLEIVDILNDLLGTQLKPIHDSLSPGDVPHSQADISRAQIELGYCPCTDLSQHLAQCLEYYLAQAQPSREGMRRRDAEVMVTS
jgi:UDP-glucose 4-epimerase